MKLGMEVYADAPIRRCINYSRRLRLPVFIANSSTILPVIYEKHIIYHVCVSW